MDPKEVLEKITPAIKSEMEEIWFVADLHHGHPLMVGEQDRPVYIEYEGERSLRNKEYKKLLNIAHNKWLLNDVFNKWVGPDDTVYILGDISMQKKKYSEYFIEKLHGKKTLIIGNHDRDIIKSPLFIEATHIKDFIFKRENIYIHIVLCHYPIFSWNRKHYGSWHLYGHVHGKVKNRGLSLDVGIDNIEGPRRPINLYEVISILADRDK